MQAAARCALLLLIAPLVLGQTNTSLWSNGAREKMCGRGTYHDSLDLAFQHATAATGETLVTVQVLPSFRPEYALVLKRVGPEIKLLRARFQEQLWARLGPPLHVPKTRQQCLDLALSAKVDTVDLPAPTNATAQLWAAFGNINLNTDTCPRHGKQCALLQDGMGYVVQTNNGRSLRITEVRNLKGIQSENAALLDWVHTLVQVAGSSQAPK